MINEKIYNWNRHYQEFGRPEYVTSLLHEAAPILKQAGWYVTDIDEGICRSVLSNCSILTNQHGTLQGSAFLLSADYTGGIALSTLFHGMPTFGVHRVQDGYGNNLWLSHVQLKYSTAVSNDLVVSCHISPGRYQLLKKRFWAGKRAVEKVDLDFFSQGKLSGKGSATYFFQKIHYEDWLNLVARVTEKSLVMPEIISV